MMNEQNEIMKEKKRIPYVTLTLFLVMFYAIGFFIFAYFVNVNKTTYTVTYESAVISAMEKDKAFFENAKYVIDENGEYVLNSSGKKKTSLSAFYNKLDELIEKKEYSFDNNSITIKASYFISGGSETVNQKSYNNFQTVLNNIFRTYDKDAKNINYEINNYYSPWLYGLFFIILGVGFDVAYMFLIYKKQKDNNYEGLFTTICSKEYWKDSVYKFKHMKIFDITLLAILLALILACKYIPIPSGFGGLGLGLTYLVLAIACMIYGPVWALLIGLYSDIIGFLIAPTTFIPDYTLQAMVTCFMYGIFFYKKKFSFGGCLTCRLIINIIINGIWGSFLMVCRYQKIYEFKAFKEYMLFVSMPKNIVYLIPQTILLYIVLRSIIPLLKQKNIVPKNL